MTDFAQIIAKAKLREKVVPVCLDGAAAGEVDRLEAELAAVSDGWAPESLASKDPREALAKKIAAARKKVRASEVPFTLRALGDKAWSDLAAKHPSKKKDEPWDFDTFPPALLAASCVDPKMNPEQVDELREVLNQGQLTELMNAAFEVNQEPTKVPFSLASSAILSSIGEK